MAFDPRIPARERTAFGNFELNRTHLKTGTIRVPFGDETIERNVAHAATLAVCARATDVADARELLAMLGLDTRS